jgi:hypothetical protein
MDIVSRIWPREAGSSTLDLSLAERLKQLTEQVPSDQAEKDSNDPARPVPAGGASAVAQDTSAIAVTEVNSQAEAGAAEAQPPAESKNQVELANSARAGDPASSSGGQPEIPAKEEPAVPAAERKPAATTTAAPQSTARENSPAATPVATDPPAEGRRFFRAPRWGSKPQEPAQVPNRPPESPHIETGQTEAQQAGDQQAENLPERSTHQQDSQALSQQFLEQFKAAVDRAEATGEDTLASVRQALVDLQSAKQEFETEIRDRLDGALAEYERRLAADTLVEDAAGQLEQRTRQATDKIFHEVKEQAWVMLNAVAGELRSFRDQFGQEVQDRVGLLDQATQQALQVKENLEAALPEAKDVLQSLPLAGQEAAARVQAASAAFAEQLQSSRDALSQEIAAQKEALKALLHDCHQDEQRLKEEIEKFRIETGTAYDLLGRKADESLERLNAGAEEAGAHAREGLENLAGEIEQRMLSGELFERATGQIERAAQEVVEPALERIRNAGVEADSLADSLTRTGEDVVGRLGTARQEIESRLDTLMEEQRNRLESSMNGFHRKAAEELGNVVERVVAQSSQQLDERLRSLFDDLLSSTSEQINGTARATLNSLHDGLKGVFEPSASEAAAGSGNQSGGE